MRLPTLSLAPAASAALVALVALTPACGSPGSFSGAVSGKKLEVKSSAFAIVDIADDNQSQSDGIKGPTHLGTIILSNSDDVCDDAKSGKLRAGKSYFFITLVKLDLATQASVAPTTGAYAGIDTSDVASGATLAAATGGIASGYFYAGDGSCKNTLDGTAAAVGGGSVTVSTLKAQSGGNARGDYKLVVGRQKNAVSGSFDAPYCAAVGNLRNAADSEADAPPCR